MKLWQLHLLLNWKTIFGDSYKEPGKFSIRNYIEYTEVRKVLKQDYFLLQIIDPYLCARFAK